MTKSIWVSPRLAISDEFFGRFKKSPVCKSFKVKKKKIHFGGLPPKFDP